MSGLDNYLSSLFREYNITFDGDPSPFPFSRRSKALKIGHILSYFPDEPLKQVRRPDSELQRKIRENI